MSLVDGSAGEDSGLVDSGARDGGRGDSGLPDSGPCCPADCPYGCNQDECRCWEFRPSNGIPLDWIEDPGVSDAFPSMVIPEEYVYSFDTDTGRIAILYDDWWTEWSEYRPAGNGVINGIRFEVISQAQSCAPDIGLFVFESFTAPSNRYVTFGGMNAAAIAVGGDFTVESSGFIFVSAWYTWPGPGGGIGGAGGTFSGGRDGEVGVGCGGAGGGNSDTAGHDPGGGGGGFGGIGGIGGGTGGGGTSAGAAGSPYCGVELEPLCAGSGGGGGGGQTDTWPAGGGHGGGGGGALQIVSLGTSMVQAWGYIMAGGGGCGWDGAIGTDWACGGGGGGSGGGILIESPVVTIEGLVTANGGAGCAGNGAWPGENGGGDDTQAQGSTSWGSTGGEGGDGSGGASAAGWAGGSVDWDGGGGGGGAGRIRINTLDATAAITGVVSPYLSTGLASLGEIALE